MKKIFIHIKLIILVTTLIISEGCKKILDVNKDPNNPDIENATPEVLFPSALISTAARVHGDLAILGGIWAQFWTQNNGSSQYRDIDSYNLSRASDEVNRAYQELFSGALADYQLAIQKSEQAQDWRYFLMNTVMKAYTYEVLVDLYDQVPYTEALQGRNNLQPKFDDGHSIYIGLLAEIDNALSKDFKSLPFTSTQAKTDFVFGENGSADFDEEMDNWVKFANTLKLKMYLRMVNANPDEAEAGIRALYEQEAQFLDENAGLDVFVDVPNKSNPMYEYNVRRLNTPVNLKASETLVSWLNANNDPRTVPYFGEENPQGMNQGDFTALSPAYSNVPTTDATQSPTDPVWFISEAESYFMQAEAIERYSLGSGAEEMYNKGVTAAFAQVDLTPGTLLEGAYAYPVSGSLADKLKAIITQKWVSFASFPGSHALEAFFEHNRTGYPQISPVDYSDDNYVPGQWVYSANGVTPGNQFPKRLVFPDFERTRNTNTPEEVPITTKVWWGQ